MRNIPAEEVVRRVRAENPWWSGRSTDTGGLKRRAYFGLLYPLVTDKSVRRAVLLMGPRRVGKTVLLHHVIDQLIADGHRPDRICYLSVDHPLYNDCGLHDLLRHFSSATGADISSDELFVIFDEIQYLRQWETHLKTLVDEFPNVRFIASGSAAAALKLKSVESGAGRFTDFLLPPLTFYEYLDLLGRQDLISVTHVQPKPAKFEILDIEGLNEAFVHYLNFGGYPEVIFSETIQQNMSRFIKSDIVDKVLLRDLPSLYGIQDIQELNALFTALAFNTANEVSLEELSKNSGVAKNTIKRYIEYLEAAFLIRCVHRVDRLGKRFQRATHFKVYLTNPSLRSALFSPTEATDPFMGHLAETGIFSQWFHATGRLSYARWSTGEVDIVGMDGANIQWAVEVKWSDRHVTSHGDLDEFLGFCRDNEVPWAMVTTRTRSANKTIVDIDVEFRPASYYCYLLGYNIINSKNQRLIRFTEDDLAKGDSAEHVADESPERDDDI